MKRIPTAIVAIVVVIGIAVIMFFVSQIPIQSVPPKLTRMAGIPADLDLSRTRPSSRKLFTVSVTTNLDPIAINKMHGWEILVKNQDGAPVDGAEISIIGGMPMHQHGLPTAPRVTKNIGQGKYLLKGMKFNMPGWWELIVQIDAGKYQDHATFNLVLK